MNKPLSNIQILQELNKDYFTKNCYKAVLPRDKLLHNFSYPAAFIINTKPSSHYGKHWFAIYYNEKREATFFDSYGQHPEKYRMSSYLNKTSSKWIYNNIQLQGLISSTCGYYCVHFINV